jgi:hypothetical protein
VMRVVIRFSNAQSLRLFGVDMRSRHVATVPILKFARVRGTFCCAARLIGTSNHRTSASRVARSSELDRLKMRVDPPAAGSLQGTEQLIAPRTTSLSFGNGDVV